MKYFALLLYLICFTTFVTPQTPSFSVKFRLEEIMSHGDECLSKYTISLERCNFREAEINYSHDTSKVNWNNLPEDILKNINCNELSSVTKKEFIIDYYYHNHDFAFENIIRINVYREKRSQNDTMIVNFPIKISSFVTMVDFGKLYFCPGKFDLTDDMIYEFDDNKYLIIKPKENVLPK
jgi:hypothetical protein